jgi:hypothetical protein
MKRFIGRRAVATLVLSLVTGAAFAQGDTARLKAEYTSHAQTMLDDIAKAKNEGRKAIYAKLDPNARPTLYALIVSGSVEPPPLARLEEARIDKQVGGAGSNAGSTSIVSKGSVPAILGLAVENGALTRSVSGTTVTFRGNPLRATSTSAKPSS